MAKSMQHKTALEPENKTDEKQQGMTTPIIIKNREPELTIYDFLDVSFNDGI